MRWRWILVPALTLITAAVGVEALARRMQLDQRQGTAIAVARHQLIAEFNWKTGEAVGLDYVPRGFSADAEGFTSAWGRCDYAHPGPTLLALGDSTTRQTGHVGDLPSDDPRHAWPALLRQRLPEGWQLCAFAEDGYHPSDLAAFLEAVGPKLKPALVVALLCENDLQDELPRLVIERGDRLALYQPAQERLAFAPLYVGPLYDASEAFRFLHFRLQDRFGHTRALPAPQAPARRYADAIRRLEADPSELALFYLPRLEDPPPSRTPGPPVHTLQLPTPLRALRREPDDPIHLNPAGQRAVADAMTPMLTALQQSP
ncbi:MAG: SGNH/GDSL hydrolase family protein [Alphaproteobacteria bacterium]|nr:SGNH/GDSL hydrolase family protein [Alphaproteobacteria bacterium]